jgi:nicotinate-nucleotide pyrophosphorylase (carboxylating)
MNELEREVAEIIARGHAEDCVHHDATSLSCLCPERLITAHVLLKENARVAGLPFLIQSFPDLDVTLLTSEGIDYPARTPLAAITGPAHRILACERTALNLLQHCCGIATLTSRYVQATSGLCDILDTRKTLPGLRHVQKYAVRMGGGKNHRFHLAERILIKSTHLSLSKTPIHLLIDHAKKRFPELPIEIEVENLEQLKAVMQTHVDFIMLDNMDIPMMEAAVKLIQKSSYVEASGNMTWERIPAVSATGVDGISVGALTHSVKAIDISLKINL